MPRYTLEANRNVTLTVTMLWTMGINQPQHQMAATSFFNFVTFAALAFSLLRTDHFGLPPVFIYESVFGGAIELTQSNFNEWVTDIFSAVLGISLGLVYWGVRQRQS